MLFSMDLNASPLPEEDEQPYEEPIQYAGEVQVESAAAIYKREREERRRRMRENYDDVSRQNQLSRRNDYAPQSKTGRYSRNREAPQGWLDCPSFGEPIDKIIPSKVPLDESYNDVVVAGKRYSSKQVTDKQKKAGREIGLVIDLTNTSRYYSPLEWTRKGIKHVKIPCKGRDAVPDNESVNIFVYEVLQFLDRQKNSKVPKYILVHCTHGHNRTGFMIIHYLMRTQLSSVAEALHIFSQKRPPGIYKHDYILSLFTFYHEVPDAMVCPSTPEWKRSSDLDLNGEALPDDDDDGNDEEAAPNENSENKLITNDDVLGDKIPYDQQDDLRKICLQLLDLNVSGRGKSLFPGSHPVSLNCENLQLLRQKYYYATWKADGTRYMMLIMRHGCYLIDRNFSFRRVQMRFPLRNVSEGFHDMTLIDGEMVIDKVPHAGLKRRYLAYDLMALSSISKVKLPFSERWKLIEEEICQPRSAERKQFDSGSRSNPVYKYEMEIFSVRRKDFWLLSTVKKLLKVFIPSLSHEADGLIFQGWDDPYVTRTHEGLLKWKYPQMNSVDFEFEIGSENRQLVFLNDRGKKKLVDGARILFGDDIDVSALSKCIIECSWNPEEHCWCFMRVRTDKATPNEFNTFRKVMRSIGDNITEEKLLIEIDEIIRLPMYVDKINRDTRHQQRRKAR